MLDAARLRRTDGGLVRAITPVSSTPDAAFATLTTFSTALFPYPVFPSAMRISASFLRLATTYLACSGWNGRVREPG